MRTRTYFGLYLAFLTLLIIGISGCTGAKHQSGSTYEKTKSDYEKRREGSARGSRY